MAKRSALAKCVDALESAAKIIHHDRHGPAYDYIECLDCLGVRLLIVDVRDELMQLGRPPAKEVEVT